MRWPPERAHENSRKIPEKLVHGWADYPPACVSIPRRVEQIMHGQSWQKNADSSTSRGFSRLEHAAVWHCIVELRHQHEPLSATTVVSSIRNLARPAEKTHHDANLGNWRVIRVPRMPRTNRDTVVPSHSMSPSSDGETGSTENITQKVIDQE